MNPSVTIIGIAGDSGAGKSLLANQLHQRLCESGTDREVYILNEDRYYRQRDDLSFEKEKRSTTTIQMRLSTIYDLIAYRTQGGSNSQIA